MTDKRLEPGPHDRPGTRAGRPADDRLVDERFSKTLRRKIGPVDRWGGPGKVEPDRRPAGEVGELHQTSRPYPET